MDIPQAGRSSIESLPVESLRVICESVDRSSDLWAFALCNWMLNEVATPALYSTIDIEVFSSIYSCVRSLASAPSKTTLTRDLASFVETISLYDPNYRDEPTRQKCWQCNVIDSNIEKAVGRMRRLRSFVCRMGIYHSAETFLTLASGTLPFVRDIDMQAVLPRAQTDADNAMTAPIALSRTGLRTLKLGLYSSTFSASYREFICSLLAASRCTLESLSLRFKALDALRPAWQSIPSFPVLQELSVPPAILKEPAFQDTSSIRHIILRGLEDFLQLTPSDLPNLEDVTCFPDQLQYFLIKGAEHRRPIKTVTLSHVKYERTYLGGYYAIGHDYALEWERHICPALGMLQYSGAYLTRLSFLVGSLCVRTLSRFLPVFIKLEFLAIMLQFAPGEDGEPNDIFSVATMLPHMPRLHTFLLSDGPAKTIWSVGGAAGPFYYAHDEDYQRRALAAYDEQSSSLRRVAFTSEFEWEKREDGWHPWGYVIAEQEILSDDEDDDSC